MTRQVILISLALILISIIFEVTDLDIWLEDYFYNFNSHHWILNRYDHIKKLIFYDGIKVVFIIFILLIIVALTLFRKTRFVQEYKAGLLIVLLSTLLIPAFVGTLKSATNTPCPKNITHYGGSYPYVTFLQAYPQDFKPQGKIKCFPAGHASGGFALLSLFFLFKKKRNKIIALVFALTLGWGIGLYKMLIGDHFLSHTIDSMLIAWLLILAIMSITYRYIKPVKDIHSPD